MILSPEPKHVIPWKWTFFSTKTLASQIFCGTKIIKFNRDSKKPCENLIGSPHHSTLHYRKEVISVISLRDDACKASEDVTEWTTRDSSNPPTCYVSWGSGLSCMMLISADGSTGQYQNGSIKRPNAMSLATDSQTLYKWSRIGSLVTVSQSVLTPCVLHCCLAQQHFFSSFERLCRMDPIPVSPFLAWVSQMSPISYQSLNGAYSSSLRLGFVCWVPCTVLNTRAMSQRDETAFVYVTWADLVIRLPVPL